MSDATPAPRKPRDTRIPASVTRCGKVIVRIYDEEAYRANIAQYYGTDESSTTARPDKRTYTPRAYHKQKPQARYAWAKGSLGISVSEQKHAG